MPIFARGRVARNLHAGDSMDASCMEDTHVADQNRNQGSKQGDGSDGNFKATPTDKEGTSRSGGSGSGMGSSGTGGSSGSSGTSSAGGSKGSGSTGYKAGSSGEDEEDFTAGDEGLDEEGGSSSGSSGSSGSRNR
jgi:hypothetical protein